MLIYTYSSHRQSTSKYMLISKNSIHCRHSLLSTKLWVRITNVCRIFAFAFFVWNEVCRSVVVCSLAKVLENNRIFSRTLLYILYILNFCFCESFHLSIYTKRVCFLRIECLPSESLRQTTTRKQTQLMWHSFSDRNEICRIDLKTNRIEIERTSSIENTHWCPNGNGL